MAHDGYVENRVSLKSCNSFAVNMFNTILNDLRIIICLGKYIFLLKEFQLVMPLKKLTEHGIARVSNLWRHITYNSRGARHTMYAMRPMLLSNSKRDAT